MSGERIKPDSERKAVPIPEGMIDPEALKQALHRFWRETQYRTSIKPFRDEPARIPKREPKRRDWNEPISTLAA